MSRFGKNKVSGLYTFPLTGQVFSKRLSLHARHKYFRNKSSPYIKSMPDLFVLQGCKMENVQPSFFRLHSS